MDVIIAPKARSDIASILAWTNENFGPQILERYTQIIATAGGRVLVVQRGGAANSVRYRAEPGNQKK